MKRLLRGVIAVMLAVLMLLSSAAALTVDEALGLLESSYLRALPAEVYKAQTLDELFALLGDPYTYYMDEEEYRDFVDAVESTVDLVGIGVSIQYTPEGFLVLEALKGGPALSAGLRAGDLIVAVDGVSCVPAEEHHRSLILGEEGTEVVITVLRDGASRDYTLRRAAVVVPNTETEVLEGHIGHISCVSFGSDTGALFLDGVETCRDEVDCWLIDVRGNSGGFTDAAVEAVGVFAGAGRHVYLLDGAGNLYYYSYGQEPATDHPAVVLVDGNTASAAEAFAAGMRDLRGGLIVGSRTFGKGVAQVVFDGESAPELFDHDALKVTAYRFYSNGGTTNDRVGVIPTLLVDDEAAYEVALAICGASGGDTEDRLMLLVDGWSIDLDCTKMSGTALTALLEAVPPGALLSVYEDGLEIALTPAQAAQRLGVEFRSRWLNDVSDSRFAKEINTLATYRVICGDDSGSFYPNEALTRGEACVLLGRALGLTGSEVARFADVAEESACAPYVNAMAELGMVVGFGDGTFRPDRVMTQQEFDVLLARVAGYLNFYIGFSAGLGSDEGAGALRELGFGAWACDSVSLLSDLGALQTADGQLDPGAPVLREEAAANLYRVLVEAGVLAE